MKTIPGSLALLGLLACTTPTPTPEATSAAEQAARHAAEDLRLRLGAELKHALAAGPADQALHVCADVAQELTASIGADHGLSLRRTALRVRNPANAPDAYERAWMEAALARDEGPPPFTAEVLPGPSQGHELRYVEPLVLVPLCTSCHGAPGEIPPAVQAALASRYPGDQATGFAPGDLRGVISVRVRLD